jgi:cytochrome oxidase Cu insertion factor (SCO1/SenC/PrrC family)
MKGLVSISLLFCIITLTACSRKETTQPAVERKVAPDFTVRDLTGKETRPSDLKGKVALVNYWAT